jgi:hypothetical protein
VETVLLYHVVPGATIDARAAFRSDNAALTTAQGSTLTVDVRSGRHWYGRLRLIDADTSDRNPRVVFLNINKGNRQIATVGPARAGRYVAPRSRVTCGARDLRHTH